MPKHTVLISWATYETFEAKDENEAVSMAVRWAAGLRGQEAEDVMRQANLDVEPVEIERSYRLTDEGRKEVRRFIKECEAFRKELLDAGKDTADNTDLPTEEGILEDIEEWIDEDGAYYNAWGVTDNYDLTISLQKGKDFEVA